MTQEEAFQRIITEYPEFTEDAAQIIREGGDLMELMSTLDFAY